MFFIITSVLCFQWFLQGRNKSSMTLEFEHPLSIENSYLHEVSDFTLSQMTNFRLSKLNEFADDNFTFDENGSEFSKRVANTVGKGEIAHYKQFFLCPQCFLKSFTADT